ncbi:hypothetical protein PTI98_008897 [Pleurotus ostreatus]|nr:hypothetical protein PTI98_008897 [Pleurotus ostreatus]
MGRTLTFLSLHPTLTEDTVQVHINIYSLHPTLTEDTVQFQHKDVSGRRHEACFSVVLIEQQVVHHDSTYIKALSKDSDVAHGWTRPRFNSTSMNVIYQHPEGHR